MPRAALYVCAPGPDEAAQHEGHARALMATTDPDPILYVDGVGAQRRRPALARLMADARGGLVASVLVFSLDDIHPSMARSLKTVVELRKLGIPIASVQEPWLGVPGPAGEAFWAGLEWALRKERERAVAKTLAGMRQAVRQGKRLGRPRVPVGKLAAAAALVREGMPKRGAARAAGVSDGALRNFLKSQACHLAEPAAEAAGRWP